MTGGQIAIVYLQANSLGLIGGGGEHDDEPVTSDSSAFHMLSRCRDAQTAFDEAIQLQSTLRKRNRRLAKHLKMQQEVIEEQKVIICNLRRALSQALPSIETNKRNVGESRPIPLGESDISPTVPFFVDEGTHGNFGPDRSRDRSSRLATQPYCTTSGRLEIDKESRPIPAVLCCGTIYIGSCTTLAVSHDPDYELSDLGGGIHIYQMVQHDSSGTRNTLSSMAGEISGGGGAAEAEAIGKAQQKVLRADVEFAPKQIRALLVLDSKLREECPCPARRAATPERES